MDNARDKFHKLALNESFERVAQVAKERDEFNRLMALSNGSNPMDNVPMQSDVLETARRAVERLAHTKMDLSLSEWNDLSGAILAALNSRKHDPSALVAATSSIDFHQRRGMLSDTVDWAVLEYDEFMKDDAYDAQAVLDRIIARLREVNAILAGASQ